MGWLGWEPEKALAMDVNMIALALEGRSDLLSTIFGDGKRGKDRPKEKVTAGRFKSFVARFNGGRKRG